MEARAIGDRYYLHAMPKKRWETWIKLLSPEAQIIAQLKICELSELSESDRELMKRADYRPPYNEVQQDWIYFNTHTYSRDLDGELEMMLEGWAPIHYGSW